MNTETYVNMPSFIWSVADLLRGHFKQSQFGRVILPFTLLRRLECVLEPTKDAVVKKSAELKRHPEYTQERMLLKESRQKFFNSSPLTLGTLSDTQTDQDLMSYVQSFSTDAREVFEHFEFENFVQQLQVSDLLYQVVQRFAAIDLSPASVSSYGMGLVFEELIRMFAESSNETAGEHFTPRDIVQLATSLVMTGQDTKLAPNSIVTIYDPTCATGGFLSEGQAYIHSISESVTVSLFGQELNPESYAICKADMLIKGQAVANIKLGNTLSNDQLSKDRFDFMLSNPPFGVDWKSVQKFIDDEHKKQGYAGRFGPGLPRVSDGSLLFLLHLVSKMRDPKDGGSRIGIILNGSPLFTGGAGSGESEIRRYLLTHDLLEAIIALPTDMFYNTGIATYVWVLSNTKAKERQGKVQLINGTEHYERVRKSLGSKRNYITEEQINELVRVYGEFAQTPVSKIFDTTAFGYRRITVERPLRLNFQASTERINKILEDATLRRLDQDLLDVIISSCQKLDSQVVYRNRDEFDAVLKKALATQGVKITPAQYRRLRNLLGEQDPEADICCNAKGQPEPDSGLRDYENVPLNESVHEYFEREVLPHVPDAWIDESKTDQQDGKVGIVGYEIPFNRHFYQFVPPRPLAEIDADLKACTDRIKQMIEGLSV